MAIIGAVWDEEDFSPFVGEESAGFGEFDIVTDIDTDSCFGSGDDLKSIATVNSPVSFFSWGDMEFRLEDDISIRHDNRADVIERIISSHGVASPYDINTVFFSELGEEVEKV